MPGKKWVVYYKVTFVERMARVFRADYLTSDDQEILDGLV